MVHENEESNGSIQESGKDVHEIQEQRQRMYRLDKLLLSLVKERPALYDFRVPQKDRTRMAKDALWAEISLVMSEQLKPEAAESRWRYLRENYIKARKKEQMKQEQSSSSLKQNIPNKAPSYRYYNDMRFMDDALDYQKTVTLSNALKSRESRKRPRIVQWQFRGKSNDKLMKNASEDSIKKHSHVYKINPLPLEEFNKLEEKIHKQQENNIVHVDVNAHQEETYDQLFLEYLQKPIEAPCPVDGFLLRLGEGLKRLPYRERSKLEIEFLTRLNEVEEQLDQ